LCESDSSLESPKPEVSLYNDFEFSYLIRPNLHDDMPLPNLEQEKDIPEPLSLNLAPEPSLPKDVTINVLAFLIPPTSFTQSFEFEEGEEFENTSDFDEHHDFNESKATCS